MSLIVCAQNCRYQIEGYCQLNSVTSLSGNNEAKCGYYEKSDKSDKASSAFNPLAEDTQSVR